jgi:hypothetical protein
MKKLVLDSRYLDARKLSECFVGCDVYVEDSHSPDHFVGVYGRGRFSVEGHAYALRDITIDLTRWQPNIYKCMEHGLRVEVVWKLKSGDYLGEPEGDMYDFSINYNKIEFIRTFSDWEIKSIKILGIDKMKGVEITK